MENAAINSRIATLRNSGKTYPEISEMIGDEFNKSISPGAIKERVNTMRSKGAMDIERENEQDLLDGLEKEICGFFKIGVLDIETTGLWADFGYVLVAVIKNLDSGEHEVFRLDECKSFHDSKLRGRADFWKRVDKELLEKIRQAYEEYDIIIHFNGRNFDIKFLNTRMLKNGLPLLPEMKQLDIYQIAKHRIRLRSKRLDAIKDFLEIDEKEEGHKWEYWQMAGAGVKEGYDYVVDHCKRDVDRLAKVARIMKQYINYIGR